MLCGKKATTKKRRSERNEPRKTETQKVGVDCEGRFTEGTINTLISM
jgi:hypothetical protein